MPAPRSVFVQNRMMLIEAFSRKRRKSRTLPAPVIWNHHSRPAYCFLQSILTTITVMFVCLYFFTSMLCLFQSFSASFPSTYAVTDFLGIFQTFPIRNAWISPLFRSAYNVFFPTLRNSMTSSNFMISFSMLQDFFPLFLVFSCFFYLYIRSFVKDFKP